MRGRNALRVAIIVLEGPNNAKDTSHSREENAPRTLGFGGAIWAIVEQKGMYVLEDQ